MRQAGCDRGANAESLKTADEEPQETSSAVFTLPIEVFIFTIKKKVRVKVLLEKNKRCAILVVVD